LSPSVPDLWTGAMGQKLAREKANWLTVAVKQLALSPVARRRPTVDARALSI
jgi:hypothetical protein